MWLMFARCGAEIFGVSTQCSVRDSFKEMKGESRGDADRREESPGRRS
jgi:hypothetical protein